MDRCPTCLARFKREDFMRHFYGEFAAFLRQNRSVKLDSCIFCVEKHVSRAMIYYDELLSAKESGMPDGTASVSIFKNHLKILGHLGCAIEESEEYEALNECLLQSERSYRYEGIEPDWNNIANLVLQVKENLKTGEMNHAAI